MKTQNILFATVAAAAAVAAVRPAPTAFPAP